MCDVVELVKELKSLEAVVLCCVNKNPKNMF